MAFGAVDVAMNAQGSTAEGAYGRPLMNGMHAGWCAGVISAGLIGTAAIAAGLSFTAHLTPASLVALSLTIGISRTYLPAPVAAGRSASGVRHRMPGAVYLLGVIAFCAFMVEGTVADWNGLYLRDVLGAPEAPAAPGYPIFEAGMLLGPVTIGFLSDAAGLRTALGIALVLGVLITLVARFLPLPGAAAVYPEEAQERELSMAA